MLVDLVQVTARDGVRLDGMLQEPAGKERAVTLDGVCCLHGTGGNFYSSTLFDAVGERLRWLGVAVLRVNTRGHDGISTAATARGGRRLGAAYEVLDDCRHDVAAWVEWLRGRVGPRVGLVGHSSGAIKSLYAAIHEPGLDLAGVVALSPPRLSYAAFCSQPEFLATYQEAERLVASGRPSTLVDVKLPLPFVITAAGYLEKYGPDERYNYLTFLERVNFPALITLGSEEVESNGAFRGTPGEVTAVAGRQPLVHLEQIAGADHFYSGAREALLDRVEGWLRAKFPAG